MGHTIDSCGGRQTLGHRDIAMARWWSERGGGPPPDPHRDGWLYIIDQPSSVEAGVNASGQGEPGTPYEIIVSLEVLQVLIAAMNPEERTLFAADRTWAKYRMRGQVLCRLVRAGVLRASGMWLEVGVDPRGPTGE